MIYSCNCWKLLGNALVHCNYIHVHVHACYTLYLISTCMYTHMQATHARGVNNAVSLVYMHILVLYIIVAALYVFCWKYMYTIYILSM